MSLFQPSLFEQSTRVKIVLREDHELVKLSHLVDWTALITLAATIRESKVKGFFRLSSGSMMTI